MTGMETVTTSNAPSVAAVVPQLGSDKSVAAERIVRGALYVAAGALALLAAARAGAAAAALTAALALVPAGVGAALIWLTLRPPARAPSVRVFPRSVAVVPAALLGSSRRAATSRSIRRAAWCGARGGSCRGGSSSSASARWS
jgi:hypothetical protein